MSEVDTAAKVVEEPVEAAVEEEKAPETTEAETSANDKASDEQPTEGAKSNEAEKPVSQMLKTTGKIDQTDHSKNIKFDASVLPVTDDPSKIRNQVNVHISRHFYLCTFANQFFIVLFRSSSTLVTAIYLMTSTCGS
jgi:hypothetical protein